MSVVVTQRGDIIGVVVTHRGTQHGGSGNTQEHDLTLTRFSS